MNLERLGAALDTRIGVAVVRWSVRILFVLSVLAWFVMGADGPADPRFADETGAERIAARRPVAGFGEVAFSVGAKRGCALLADTDERRTKGMQGRSDFSGYDAMVFTFDSPIQAQFINHFVPIGLSIAFFDDGGRYVSSAEMPPCPEGVSCPTYGAARPFRTAVEAPMGRLEDLGIAEGARITVGGPC